MMDLIYFHN